MRYWNALEDAAVPKDTGRDMKARLRADLSRAMKDRRTLEARVIRVLIAAIDNAEAPLTPTRHAAPVHHRFHNGSAEVERLLLGGSRLRQVLLAEIHEREHAATEFERLEKTDRAETLRAEARVARRYIE